jgi:hypothetical protein
MDAIGRRSVAACPHCGGPTWAIAKDDMLALSCGPCLRGRVEEGPAHSVAPLQKRLGLGGSIVLLRRRQSSGQDPPRFSLARTLHPASCWRVGRPNPSGVVCRVRRRGNGDQSKSCRWHQSSLGGAIRSLPGLYEAAPHPRLLLKPAFTIIEANLAYQRATMTDIESIRGCYMFDTFPTKQMIRALMVCSTFLDLCLNWRTQRNAAAGVTTL